MMMLLVLAFSLLHLSATLRIATLNTWHCGVKVYDGASKIAHQIQGFQADVVMLQEVRTQICLQALMTYLPEYSSCQMDLFGAIAIIYDRRSIIPLVDVPGGSNPITYAVWTHYKICQFLHLKSKTKFTAINMHLSPQCYGPYVACGISDVYSVASLDGDVLGKIAECEEAERAAPLRQFLDTFDLTLPALSTDLVFLGGDFNSPSSLDYTSETRGQHCRLNVSWPVTTVTEAHGFRDAYRHIFPNPKTDPGLTFSPVFNNSKDANGKPMPHDRIDFVYYRPAVGDPRKILPTAANIVYQESEGRIESEASKNNIWPSDHAAVVIDFNL